MIMLMFRSLYNNGTLSLDSGFYFMKLNKFQRFSVTSLRIVSLSFCVFGLLGCDNKTTQPVQEEVLNSESQGVSVSSANKNSSPTVDAKTLSDVASQVNVAIDSLGVEAIPDYAIDFVGRYYTEVSCQNGFAPCAKGTAMFVLTLSADGSVYRSLIQHGKVFNFKNKVPAANLSYRKDRWEIRPDRKELVVYRKEGIVLYYNIMDDMSLVMNVEKIRKQNDPQSVNENLRLPNVGYVLRKDIGNELP